MFLPKQANLNSMSSIRRCIPYLNWAIKNLPAIGKTPEQINRNRPQQLGCTVEMFVHYLLSQIYPAESVQFNLDKAEQQTHNGRDGHADPGYDISLETADHRMNIDVKWDSFVAKDATVCLELFNSYGYKGFLLNPIVNVSVHVGIEELKLPIGSWLKLKAVWVDLEKLRCDLKVEDGKHSLGNHTEEISRYGNRLLKIPVEYLKRNGYARLDTFTSYK